MANLSITSANAIFMLSVVGLYDTPQQLQGFAAEDIFDTPAIAPAETMMGVDGALSAGFVYVPIQQSIALMADSASNDLFEQWYAAQVAVSELFRCTGVIRIPSLGKSYQMANGVLTSYPTIADAKKVMQPRKYGITWESVTGVPI
jgi:hypothetical protein